MFSEPSPYLIKELINKYRKSKTMKQYILLKDLPDAKAGAILDWEDRVKAYKLQKQCGVPPNMYNWYTEADVTQSPEWFKVVDALSKTINNVETTVKNYLVCERCKINSNTKGRMIPCPRGGCEAEIKGKITITEELKLFAEINSNSVEEKEYTKEDMRECFENAKYLLLNHRTTPPTHSGLEPEFEDYLELLKNKQP